VTAARPIRRVPGLRVAQRLYRKLPIGGPAFPLVKPFLHRGELLAVPFAAGELLAPAEWIDTHTVHLVLGGEPFTNPELGPLGEAERLLRGRAGVMVDVGAAIGQYVLWLRSRFPNPIVAFEPSPVAGAVLGEMIRANGFEAVEVVHKACGATAGGFFRLKIGSNSEVDAAAAVSADDAADRPRDWLSSETFDAIASHTLTKQVPITTLDAELAGREAVAFIKIDVEGLELQVLQGAAETLRRHQPVLWIEGHPTAIGAFGNKLEDVFGLLGSHGYGLRCWIADESRPASKLGRVLNRIGGVRCQETSWERVVAAAGSSGQSLPHQLFFLATPPRARAST
jgi:FkbM family methyltransferase